MRYSKYLLGFMLCYRFSGRKLPSIKVTKSYCGDLIRIFRKKEKEKSRVNLDDFTTKIPSELEEVFREIKRKKKEEITKSITNIMKTIDVPKKLTMEEELIKNNFGTNYSDKSIYNRDIKLKDVINEYESDYKY